MKILISNINLLFEPVIFQAEYKRKSHHYEDLGFNLLFSHQH